MLPEYDALLVVSFGGPEGPDEVIPFLENVLRGKNVPRERMLEVAEHYNHFGGISPINQQNRELITALRVELDSAGIHLPIYWGNRNWRPFLPDTLRQMADHGVRRGLAFFTSAFSSYSGCRQYRENIAQARQIVGPQAPVIDKLRAFYNHPGFVATMADRVQEALGRLPAGRATEARLVFTAHSIPVAMATGSRYEAQLAETCRLVVQELSWRFAPGGSSPDRSVLSGGAGGSPADLHDSAQSVWPGSVKSASAPPAFDWALVYQSRSGPPSQPWLEPDVGDHLRELSQQSPGASVVLVPIGFISDHMEVLFDLDTEALALCEELGLTMVRAGTAGTHPTFIAMIRDLIVERMTGRSERPALGQYGPSHDVCPENCCLPGRPTAAPGDMRAR